MMVLGTLLLSTLIVGGTIGGVLLAIGYRNFNYRSIKSISYGQTAKLKWSNLRSIYRVNPSRWRYETIVEEGYTCIKTSYCALLYNTGKAWEKRFIDDETYKNSKQIIRVQLSPYGYLRFIFSGKKNTVGLEMLLKSAQGDIEVLKEIANSQIQEANDQMENIKKELQKGVNLEI